MKTRLYISLLIVCFFPNILFAQFSQQGPKLVGTGGVSLTEQGKGVSISADGNTAIMGGPDDNIAGAAWIFIRSGGVWTQQGPKLVGTGNAGYSLQGAAVSISADGNTAIIGGYGDDSGKGAAWIFTRSGGVWTQQGSKLIPTNYIGEPRFGSAVSISGDGNTVMIGSPSEGNDGSAWVFTRSGNLWTQQGSKLVCTGGLIPSFGSSVSLSADGNTAAIGGASDITGTYWVGATWIFTRSGGSWSQYGSKLIGTGYIGHCKQGASVSISSDGSTVIIGGYQDNDYVGAVWIFAKSYGGAWLQQGGKIVCPGTDGGADFVGASVSISGDGNTAIIGGYGNNGGIGSVWMYTRFDTAWYQLGNMFTGSGNIGTAWQGASVCISSNGNTAIVGGPGDNNDIGAAWVFVRSNFRLINSHSNLHKIIQGLQYTEDTVNVTTNIFSYFISNVTISIDTIHYVNVSDLEILITHNTFAESPTTTTDTLVYQVGGTGSNFIGTRLSDSASVPISNGTAPFTGNFKPSKPLSKFLGIDPAGSWNINVYDRLTGRTGTLDAWSLIVDLTPSPISIHQITSTLPKEFLLKQNYPNPFNPSTKIKFDISKSSFTIIKIYDILGREISTLVNQQLKPGTYQVDWNASNNPSGIYFYKLIVSDPETSSEFNYSETKKMILLK